MKKIPSIVLCVLTLSILTNSALAASSPATFMPNNPTYYLELQTSKLNGVEQYLKTILNKVSFDQDSEVMLQLVQAGLDEKANFGAGVMPNQSDLYTQINYFAFNLKTDTFQAIIDQNLDFLKVEDLGQDRKIYSDQKNTFFTYKNGNVFASNQRDIVSDLLLVDSPNSFTKNLDYQTYLGNTSNQAALTIFTNRQKISEYNQALENYDMPSQFTSEIFTGNSNENSIYGQFIGKLKTDSPYLNTNWSFTPELYQIINPENILFYQETKNLSDQLEKSFNSFLPGSSDSEFNPTLEIGKEVENNTGLNLEQLSSLFRGKSAFTIHSQIKDQYFPGISVISDLSNNTTAEYSLKAISENLEKYAKAKAKDLVAEQQSQYDNYNKYYSGTNPYKVENETDLFNKMFQKQDLNINGTVYHQMTLSSALTKFEAPEETTNIQTDKFNISFSWAINNNRLILTTLKNPAALLDSSSQGLSKDPNFNSIRSSNSRVVSISYIQLDNVKTFVKTFMTELAAPEYLQNDVNEFLTPFHYFGQTVLIEQNAIFNNWKVGLDISKLPDLTDTLENLFDGFGDAMRDFSYPDYTEEDYATPYCDIFNDVNYQDWHYQYVCNVYENEIMKGYSDGNFLPNKNITRAEFTKSVISALDNSGMYWTTVEPDQYFTDVDSNSWYASYVNKARAHGLIDGYNDNTFHPNDNISRAEAITITMRAQRTLHGWDANTPELANPFNDLKISDWFYSDALEAYSQGIVEGESNSNGQSLLPADPITRAQTAKIINIAIWE